MAASGENAAWVNMDRYLEFLLCGSAAEKASGLSRIHCTLNEASQARINDFFDKKLFLLRSMLDEANEELRESAVEVMAMAATKLVNLENYLPDFMAVLKDRLLAGLKEEASGKVRVRLLKLLGLLITSLGKQMNGELKAIVDILCSCLNDSSFEEFHIACQCIVDYAPNVPEQSHCKFRNVSGVLLVKLRHKDPRIRMLAMRMIGCIVHETNVSSISIVTSALELCQLDFLPAVRLELTDLVGKWLREPQERFSYFDRLILLMFFSMTDDIPLVTNTATALWEKAGECYLLLNKKKAGGMSEPSQANAMCPSVGCQALVKHHVKRMLSVLLTSIATQKGEMKLRAIKALNLLFIHAENDMEKHLETTVEVLYKGACSDQEVFGSHVLQTVHLIGSFLEPDACLPALIPYVQNHSLTGGLNMLAAYIQGSKQKLTCEHAMLILKVLHGASNDVNVIGQISLLDCMQFLMKIENIDIKTIADQIFNTLMMALSTSREESVSQYCMALMEVLQQLLGLQERNLFVEYGDTLMRHLQINVNQWIFCTTELYVFERFLIEAGDAVFDIFDEILPILIVHLNSKDFDMRLRFFNILGYLLDKARLDSRHSTLIIGAIDDLIPVLVTGIHDHRPVMVQCVLEVITKVFDCKPGYYQQVEYINALEEIVRKVLYLMKFADMPLMESFAYTLKEIGKESIGNVLPLLLSAKLQDPHLHLDEVINCLLKLENSTCINGRRLLIARDKK